MILDICVFQNFTLADELFANDLQIFETCICGKSVLLFPTIFIYNLKVTPVPFSVADFNFSNCELDILTLHCCIVSRFINICFNLLIKSIKLLQYLVKNQKIFSFTSLRMKNIDLFLLDQQQMLVVCLNLLQST